MSKSFFSIGEYAKMVGVSPEYLKFYDKKNLIKPVRMTDLTDIMQIIRLPILSNCNSLTTWGFHWKMQKL